MTLLNLAERVEAARVADRELDLAIAIAVGQVPANTVRGNVTGFCYFDADGLPSCVTVPQFTASLDSAMSLVPEGHTVQLSDWDHPTLRERGPWQAIILPFGARGAMQQFTFTNRCDHAATPALALTVAALRAIAHAGEATGDGSSEIAGRAQHGGGA